MKILSFIHDSDFFNIEGLCGRIHVEFEVHEKQDQAIVECMDILNEDTDLKLELVEFPWKEQKMIQSKAQEMADEWLFSLEKSEDESLSAADSANDLNRDV